MSAEREDTNNKHLVPAEYPIKLINSGLADLGPNSSEADSIRSAAVRLSTFLPGPSPLLFSPELSKEAGRPVLLKLEHTLPGGAFKIRGAFNKINSVLDQVTDGKTRPHFVTSSSGNHVLACCKVWESLGISGSSVFVPESVSPAKEAKLRKLHGSGLIQLKKAGRECLESELAGRGFARRTPGSTYIPAYSDWDVIRGQGTSAFELFPDTHGTNWPGQLTSNSLADDHVTLLVPAGGGGLLAGVALYSKLGPGLRTTVIGCQPSADCVLAKSVKAGRLLSYDEAGSLDTISQGTAGGVEDGSPTLDVCARYVDQWCLIDEADIAKGCLRLEALLTAAGHPRAEPAASLGVAALSQLVERGGGEYGLPPGSGPVVIFVTGGNVGDTEMERVRSLAGVLD